MEIVYNFGSNEKEFYFTVYDDELREAIITLFAEAYNIDKTKAKYILYDFDLFDLLEEEYKDDLKDFFEKTAYEYYTERNQ